MGKRLLYRFATSLAALFIFTGVTLKTLAINVEEFPKPPSLYAQAAVLMDADTGQVLYGKAEHQKQYPASLTKIMTCLLAMDNGRYEDVVTIDKEAAKGVAGTSHIALTDGEQLTVEQLLYATMLESANDAASALGIHLAGSIPMFSKLMNERAAGLGARDTTFVNANGLPEATHISTAYDLALITREALKNPNFEKFAGTDKYTIPETNKNLSRTVAHKNYMFVLNDTYEGAFAGKTGWTQEAGHCLMTVAERDGITLICVVLKSDGVVDAEFKDSTALFDYGYDHFRRIKLPWSRFPSQQVSYMDATGQERQGRLYPVGADMPLLLPTGVEESDLKIETVIPDGLTEESFSRVRVQLRLPEVAGEVMNRLAGDFPVEIRPLDLQAELGNPSLEKEPFDWVGLGKKILLSLCIVLGVGTAALLFIRWRVRRYYRNVLAARTRRGSMESDDLQYLGRHGISKRELMDYRKRYNRTSRVMGVSGGDVKNLLTALVSKKTAVRKTSGKRKISGDPSIDSRKSSRTATRGIPPKEASASPSVGEASPMPRREHATMFNQDAVPPQPPVRRPVAHQRPKEPPRR